MPVPITANVKDISSPSNHLVLTLDQAIFTGANRYAMVSVKLINRDPTNDANVSFGTNMGDAANNLVTEDYYEYESIIKPNHVLERRAIFLRPNEKLIVSKGNEGTVDVRVDGLVYNSSVNSVYMYKNSIIGGGIVQSDNIPNATSFATLNYNIINTSTNPATVSAYIGVDSVYDGANMSCILPPISIPGNGGGILQSCGIVNKLEKLFFKVDGAGTTVGINVFGLTSTTNT